jgi:hypothetical protein
MGQQTIRFRIRPDGRVDEVVEGVAGHGCLALTERIESQIGSVQQRRSTTEAFQPNPLTAHQQLTEQPSA